MSLLWLLVLLQLFGDSSPGTKRTSPTPSPAPTPTPTPKPSPAPAAKPKEEVRVVPVKSPAAKKAEVVPVAWPQAVPKDLPAWPGGWEPDIPVPAAEVTRAYQLLPTLWKKGAGTKTVEKTGDKWVTYLAFVPTKGKKGVSAWRVKEGAPSGTTQA